MQKNYPVQTSNVERHVDLQVWPLLDIQPVDLVWTSHRYPELVTDQLTHWHWHPVFSGRAPFSALCSTTVTLQPDHRTQENKYDVLLKAKLTNNPVPAHLKYVSRKKHKEERMTQCMFLFICFIRILIKPSSVKQKKRGSWWGFLERCQSALRLWLLYHISMNY